MAVDSAKTFVLAVVLAAYIVGMQVAVSETVVVVATAVAAAAAAATESQHYVHERASYQTTVLDLALD